jgi:spoIIIJ-associated protein
MSFNKKMEFEGKDVADAISKACKSLNVSQENLDIEVLTTGSSGIFGLCRQKTRLRVAVKQEDSQVTAERDSNKREERKTKSEKTKKAEKKKRVSVQEKKQEERPAPPVKPQAEPDKDSDTDIQLDPALPAQVENDLKKMLEMMNFPSEVTVTSDRENITAQIDGEYVDAIVGEKGRILDSLQYLIRKMIGKNFPDKAIISLDAGDFRANRDEELKQLGLKLAAEVKKKGRTRSIPSLNPYERRIVHIALQDDKDIRSRSVGEGLFKKVLIYRPGKGRKGSARRKKGGRNKKQ